MSNQPFHNKWHSFNHYTLPLSDYPDSGTDPIASAKFPFLGTFYNKIPSTTENTLTDISLDFPGLGYTKPVVVEYLPASNNTVIYKNPIIDVTVNDSTGTITKIELKEGGVFTGQIGVNIKPNPLDNILINAVYSVSSAPFDLISNSDHWAYAHTLTKGNSADWSLFPRVETTTEDYVGKWQAGYLGYTSLYSNSSYYESFYSTTSALSSELNYTGTGGTGWHIALSSITWRSNVSAVNIRQKVALPYKLAEQTIGGAQTVNWNLTAQTAYIVASGDYTLGINSIQNANRGGKYTLWVYVDKCPTDLTNVIFNPQVFNIKVKTNTSEYQSFTDVISLSRNTVTKIDFVYDGFKMQGRATRYFLDALTTDDIYYAGTGIALRNPNNGKPIPLVFASDSGPNTPGSRYIVPRPPVRRFDRPGFNDPGLKIKYLNLTQYPSITSFYVAGSGIQIKYFESNQYYFSYQLYGATWPTQLSITKLSYLSGSFDRVIGTLSGTSDWYNPAYSQNLIVSPMRATAPASINVTLPTNKYNLQSSNIIPISSCTRFYNVSVFSGKDKLIRSININNTTISNNPIAFNNYPQQYNFLNEETSQYTFEKIQNDYEVKITYGFQPGKYIKNNYIWLNPGDNTLLPDTLLPTPTIPVRSLNKLYTNTNLPVFYVSGPSPGTSPNIVLSGSHRYLKFTPGRSCTSSQGLTALSGERYLKSFTTFTTFKITSRPALSAVMWWVGDFNRRSVSNQGYGLLLSEDLKIYTKNELDKPIKPQSVQSLELGKIYVLANRITTTTSTRETVYLNNEISINQVITSTNRLSNFNLYFNTEPQTSLNNGSFHIYEYYLFERALATAEIRRMNLFLMDKVSKYNI